MRTIQNRLLALRYNYFQKCIKPISFDSAPDWQENFNNPEFKVVDGNFFAGHSYFSKDCVEVKNGELYLKIESSIEYREHWGEYQQCFWKIGKVEYHDMFPAYGTWVWKAIVPENSFSALWMLRPGYCPEETKFKCRCTQLGLNKIYLYNLPKHEPKPNMWVYDELGSYIGRIDKYDSSLHILKLRDFDGIYKGNYIYIGQDAITPEVDVMELLNNGKFGHTLHYGFDYDIYAPKGSQSRVKVKDHNKVYEFAVTVSPEQYRFYIDGYLTGVMRTGLSNQPLNPIMNSAVHSANFDVCPNDFIIKEFKFYEKYNW